MKAVTMTVGLSADHPESLVDTELPDPTPEGRDVLVRVQAISVNPVDTKIRRGLLPSMLSVLGWDAAGEVVEVGPQAELFKPGDPVYYAGNVRRAGANSELHVVDERLVGRRPTSLGVADAAGLPLTTLTAYEGLFERLGIFPGGAHAGRTLLVIGGAGGVGSMAIQLGKLAGLRVIATASRERTQAWCTAMGAADVVNHREDMIEQVRALGLEFVDYIFNCADTSGHWDTMVELIRPMGHICSIVETSEPIALTKLMGKSASFGWELMFTRAMFETPSMIRQHEILNQVAGWVDTGKIVSTVNDRLAPINAANLRTAHAKVESGGMIGKLVLKGW